VEIAVVLIYDITNGDNITGGIIIIILILYVYKCENKVVCYNYFDLNVCKCGSKVVLRL
jgi:hypothetical protein